MRRQGIYLNVSRRNDDLPQLIEEYSEQFNLSKADTVAEILRACIRGAKWVGQHPNLLKLEKVPVEEFSQTFDYGLKDITNLDDFNQIVD